jgi:ketosteroid isomerase-like protein
MDSSETAAREAIRDLVAQYAHAADRGRFDELATLFTDDGVLELPDGRTARGAAAIRAFLGGTGADLATSAIGRIRHHVSSHRIVVENGAEAEGFAYFLVVTDRGPDHWGRYHDRYALVDGSWRFALRRVRLDGYAAGSWAESRRS